MEKNCVKLSAQSKLRISRNLKNGEGPDLGNAETEGNSYYCGFEMFDGTWTYLNPGETSYGEGIIVAGTTNYGYSYPYSEGEYTEDEAMTYNLDIECYSDEVGVAARDSTKLQDNANFYFTIDFKAPTTEIWDMSGSFAEEFADLF